jgi:U3 small nucleolar RNA-associated protein 5
VQWTLVAHGGALASQPEVLSRLSALQKVLAERARGLDSLLILKGKLDMLEAQMTLRRHIQNGQHDDEEDESEDANVIWVEGQPTDDQKGANKLADADDGEPVELPNMNGIIGGSDDEEEDDDDDDDDDDDSEGDQEDDDESLDEAEVDHDDVDESMGEDDDSDVEATAPPRKVQKMAKSFSKGR